MLNDKHSRRRIIGLVLVILILYELFEHPGRFSDIYHYVSSLFGTIFAGFCVAFILNLIMYPIESLFTRLQRNRKHKLPPSALRAISILLTFVITLGAIVLMVVLIIPGITNILSIIKDKLPDMASDVISWINRLLARVGANEALMQRLESILNDRSAELVDFISNRTSDLAEYLFKFTTGVFGGVVTAILAIAVAIYTLAAKERLVQESSRLIKAYLPEHSSGVCFELSHLMYDKFHLFFKGQLTEAVLLGSLVFIGMLIFRFPNAGMISLLMGVCAVIPVLGPWVGSITSTLLMLVVSPIKGLLYAIFILVLQQIEDNVLYPRIVGASMGIPGLLVMCAVIIGAQVYGMIGIVIAVPLSAVLYEFIKLRTAKRLERKEAEHAHTD